MAEHTTVLPEDEASERLYRSLLDSLPFYVLRKDLRGRFTFVNGRFCELLERRADEILGKTDFDFFPQPLADKYRHDDLRVIQTGESFESVEQHAAPDGRLRYMETFKEPLRDAQGRIVGTQVVFWDVTARRCAEDQLREMYAVLENAVEGICRVDGDGKLLNTNRAFAKLLRRRGSELVGTDWLSYVERDDYQRLLRTCERLGPGAKAEAEVRMLRRDGTSFPAELVLMTATDRPHHPSGLYVFAKDVTQRKQAERQLLESERLSAIGQVVSGAAHESRNALQEILACCRLLEWEFEASQEARCLLADLHAAHDRLHRLLEALRAYAGPLQLQPQRCNLRRAVLEAWRQLDDVRGTMQVELREQGVESDVVCTADPVQLQRVFRHILENALSWCAQPAVLEVRYHGPSPACPRALQVAIGDNGPGLNTEQRERIFQPFYTTKMQGVGLGMAIAKRIVDAHQGRIMVDCRASGGTEIVVELPRVGCP